MIEIYREKGESQRIKQFEDSLIVHESSQTIANWLLTKAKVLEKAEYPALVLKALDRALEILKEKNEHSLILNLQLQRANILIKA